MLCVHVLVIAQDVDEALLRRFDRKIYVPPPDVDTRLSFFQLMLSKPELASDLSESQIDTLARRTEGYTGSDLTLVCREAALIPVREVLNRNSNVLVSGYPGEPTQLGDAPSIRNVNIQDFLQALGTVEPSPIQGYNP